MGENLAIIIVICLYLAGMLVIGYLFKAKVKVFDDFILGGRGLPWFVITMTLLATLANAQQVLGIAGFSFQTGFSFMIWFFIIVNMFIYPIIVRLGARYRGMNFSTVVDLAEERYPGSARLTVLMSIFQVMWAVFSVGISLFGGALLIEVVFNVPWIVGILISGTVTVIYCMLGGLNAVVFTDLIQWIIIVAGTAILVPLIYIQHGSFTAFFSNLLGPIGMEPQTEMLWPGFTDLFSLPPGGFITVTGIIAMGIAGSLWIPVDLGFMQRMLAAKSIAQAKRACIYFVIVITVWATLMVAMGMYGRVFFPDLDTPDAVIILLAKDTMPLLGAALFITAVTAAVMSTVSTYLNAGSAILVKNIYRRFLVKSKDDSHYLAAVRICTVIIALAAMLFAPMVRDGGVFVTALTIQMIICASLAPMIMFSTYWKRMTERAAFWGTLISAVITLAVTMQAGGGGAAFAGAGLWGIPVVFIGIIVSVVLFLLLSVFTPYNPDAVGSQFRDLFDGKTGDTYKTSRTDIYVVSGIIILVLLIFLIRSFTEGPFGAFPPLSGFFAHFTNGYFLLAALGVFLFCLLVLYLSVGWVRSLGLKHMKKNN